MQIIHQSEYKGFAKGYGNFQFQAPNAKTFEDAGFSQLAAKHFEYLLHAQLGTHQCKESFKKDSEIFQGLRKNATAEQFADAEENLEGIYSYNFSGPVKQRASSKWGDLKAHVPSAIASLKANGISSPSDERIREIATRIAAISIVPFEIPQEEEDPDTGE